MNRNKWQQVERIFNDALEISFSSRAEFVANICANDDELRLEVESLLAADEPDTSFLEESAIEIHHKQNDKNIDSRIGQTFGKYKIIEKIGTGGMGAIYLATRGDGEFQKRVAVKIIKRGMDSDVLLQRFRNERQILANLEHPFISRLLDGGTTEDGLPYLVMEYVEGIPINDFCREKNLSISERLYLFQQVCAAVSYAHRNLVIHRDLKPSNILVSKNGEPKLLDFGIAKLLADENSVQETITEFNALTPEYASPEQLRGEKLTTETDIYSLGIILYELLTESRPYQFSNKNYSEIVHVICETEPTRPSAFFTPHKSQKIQSKKQQNPKSKIRNPKLKGDLDNIVLKCLRKEPERRYLSVEKLSEDLQKHLKGLPISARGDNFTYLIGKFIQRHKIAVISAILILIMLFGGVISIIWEAHQANLQKAKAEQRFNQVRKLAHSVVFDYHDSIASLPGSTPVREKLVKDALEYLDNLSLEENEDGSLQLELASAYIKVGDVQGKPYSPNLGDEDGAMASYQKAQKILDKLIENNSANIDFKHNLATIYERIGNLQLRKGNWNDALENHKKSLAIREEILQINPDNIEYKHNLANSYLFVGDAVQVQCADIECDKRALEFQQKALNLIQNLSQENPFNLDFQRDVARDYTRVGFRLSTIGGRAKEPKYYQQALENQQNSLAIREKLAANNQTNAVDQRNFADQIMLTADAQIAMGETEKALNGYNRSLKMFKDLSAADPLNSEALRDLSFVYEKMAAAFEKVGNISEAKKNYQEVLDVVQNLQKQNSANFEDLQSLTFAYQQLGDISEKAGNLSEAISINLKILDINNNLYKITTEDGSRRYYRINCYEKLGNLYVKSATKVNLKPAQKNEDWRTAKSYYEKCIEILQQISGESPRIDEINYHQRLLTEIAKCDNALKAKG